MRTTRTRKTWTIALTAAFAVLGTAGAATAVATTGDSAAGQSDKAAASSAHAKDAKGTKGTKDGAKKLCKRAPRIEKRLERTLHKMSDEGKGRRSTARLEKRVDHAKKAGHDAIATYLTNKLETRDALAPKLKERAKDLDKVKSWCAAHHNAKG